MQTKQDFSDAVAEDFEDPSVSASTGGGAGLGESATSRPIRGRADHKPALSASLGEKWQVWQIVAAVDELSRPRSHAPAPSASETIKLRRRLLERVQASPEYATLNATERRYIDTLILELANEGGEITVKHDVIANRVGQSRRNVIRVIEALVASGLLTKSHRYLRKEYRDRGRLYTRLRIPNVYRVANRFMSALKAARKLIRRNVTAVKAFRDRYQRVRGVCKKSGRPTPIGCRPWRKSSRS